MQKKILIIFLLLLLTGCGMTVEEMEDKKIECTNLGLRWQYGSGFGKYIYCSSRKLETSFDYCIAQCEFLFHEQAETWSNGSENQSEQANICLDKCLKFNLKNDENK